MNKILVVSSNTFNKRQMNDLTVGLESVAILDHIRQNHVYKERSLMEENEAYRQVIPYIVVQHSKTKQFLVSQRTDKQAETRLHNKYSIGLGGHIDWDEKAYPCPLYASAERELMEETGWNPAQKGLTFQGIILSDIEPIDRVHVGVLYHYFTDIDPLHNEDGKHIFSWADTEELLDIYGRMERWSSIVFDTYISPV
jgi:predicted NUDIX family phosphoesterase